MTPVLILKLREANSAAMYQAKRGMSGNPGEPLPPMLSKRAAGWIAANPTLFRRMVARHSVPN